MKSESVWFADLLDGTTRRACWLDKHVPVGAVITLKDSEEPERHWTVTWIGQPQSRALLDGQRGWHVGGL